MVIMAIMDLLKTFLLFIIGLFPEFPKLSFIQPFIDTFFYVVRLVDRFISVPTLGVCFVAIIICYNARAIWSIVMWVVRKIPGVS